MPAILELPEARARVSLLSVEAYEALAEMGAVDKRAELIRGVIFEKMPKPPLHRKLTKWLYDHCRDQRWQGLVVFQEAPLRLTDSEPEPDVLLVSGCKSDFDARHPTSAELVVEVAVTGAALDRENRSLYAEAGVSEYWIVLALEQQIEVYRQPVDGVYQQKCFYSIGEMLACESVPGLQVTLAEWFS